MKWFFGLFGCYNIYEPSFVISQEAGEPRPAQQLLPIRGFVQTSAPYKFSPGRPPKILSIG